METQKPILPPQVTDAPRPVKWLRGAVAVLVILLMGSILLNFVYWSRGAETKMDLKALQQRYDSLLQTVPATPHIPAP